MDYLINVKTNKKNCVCEYLIKRYDVSQDMSRAAVFEREVREAEKVEDWKAVRSSLAGLEDIQEAPVFTNLQARYGEETKAALDQVRRKMLADLREAGFKVLRVQYMLLLLQKNYLDVLMRERTSIKNTGRIEENDVDLPEMAKLMCEMMLRDKDCDELRQIRRILVEWRNR